MSQIIIRLFLLIPLLLVSACGGYTSKVALDPYNPEYYLTDELTALRRSGAWGEQDLIEQQPRNVFPVIVNNQVRMYLDLFQNSQRKSFEIWLERSGRYLPLILGELHKTGLPPELVYLAMIESGYNDRAKSSAGATGLWQFIASTGRKYDLTIDQYVDERQDPVKATRSAIRFLSDLHQQFGDWHLAVAAYNGGPGKIERGLERYQARTFWGLARHDYLALETKRYVPKLIAAIIIARDPGKYGFTSTNHAPPLHYDTIEVGPGLDLTAAALISNSSDTQLAQLNPELLNKKTPINRASYQLNIPAGSGRTARLNLERLHPVVTTTYKKHVVGATECLADISDRYQVSQASICKANQISASQLFSGQSLSIPIRLVDYRLLPSNQQSAQLMRGNQRVVHQVMPGESLTSIALDYDVPPHLLYTWNKSISHSAIYPGQHLALYMDQQITAHAMATSPTNNLPVLSGPKKSYASNTHIKQIPSPQASTSAKRYQSVTGSASPVLILAEQKKKRIDAPRVQPKRYHWYLVQDGDSLWGIAQRFNTSPSQIRALNNMSSNAIYPGKRLKLNNV